MNYGYIQCYLWTDFLLCTAHLLLLVGLNKFGKGYLSYRIEEYCKEYHRNMRLYREWLWDIWEKERYWINRVQDPLWIAQQFRNLMLRRRGVELDIRELERITKQMFNPSDSEAANNAIEEFTRYVDSKIIDTKSGQKPY